ncbi:MAG: hypothetical protein ACRDZ3_01910 [Acidimicrobiia bacterium]
MAERIAIEQGRHPWLPSEDAEVVETLHHYDLPLIGVIRQGDTLHLFRCIEGHVDSTQVWAYTRITPEELETLQALGPGELDAAIDTVVSGKPTVLALADDQRGLTISALLEDVSGYPTPLHAARAVLGEALGEVDAKLGRSVA